MYISKKMKLLTALIIVIFIFVITIFCSVDYSSKSNDDCTKILENEVIELTEKKESTVILKDEENLENNIIDNKENELNLTTIKDTVEFEPIENIKEPTVGNELSIEHLPENSGNFVIINSVGYEKFTLDISCANVYVNAVNYYAENLNDDITIYNLIAPTSSEFNIPSEFRNLSGSQKDGIKYAYSNMNEKIITVDAYSNLEANKGDYLYFKTDHHWTALGAYRAYESFMETKGEEVIPLDNYKRVDSENKYLGSIYNMTDNKRLENNLDDIWYYNPLLPVEYSSINRDETTWNSSQIIFPSYFEHKRKYSAFMGGDTAFSHIKIDSNCDKNILVIKDSYGNAFIPFLLPHYGDIYVADPRYFTKNIFDVIKENKIKELLIIDYATVLQLPVFSQMIKDMVVAKITSGTSIK